jgi:cation diffusion facilitator CzcD-associated flavoprotein CzcO
MPEPVTVVGAGPAGLAVAACLKQRGVSALVLDAGTRVGSAWRNHYDRLHLHTHKGGSALPGLSFPAHYPRYPSREQFIGYLEDYARHFQLQPAFEEPVRRIARNGAGWVVATSGARFLGARSSPPGTPACRWSRLAGESSGRRPASSRYRNGAAWKGKEVLVVGLVTRWGDRHRPPRAARAPTSPSGAQ